MCISTICQQLVVVYWLSWDCTGWECGSQCMWVWCVQRAVDSDVFCTVSRGTRVWEQALRVRYEYHWKQWGVGSPGCNSHISYPLSHQLQLNSKIVEHKIIQVGLNYLTQWRWGNKMWTSKDSVRHQTRTSQKIKWKCVGICWRLHVVWEVCSQAGSPCR